MNTKMFHFYKLNVNIALQSQTLQTHHSAQRRSDKQLKWHQAKHLLKIRLPDKPVPHFPRGVSMALPAQTTHPTLSSSIAPGVKCFVSFLMITINTVAVQYAIILMFWVFFYYFICFAMGHDYWKWNSERLN